MGIFEGKVAIITGGGKAKSIGYGVATAYAKEGANLVITGRNEQKLIDGKEELERLYGIKVLAMQCEGGDEEAVKATVKKTIETFGRIDVLINNAAIWRTWKTFMEVTTEEWKKFLDINVMGVVYCTRAVLGSMIANHYGRIVNVGSVAGIYGNGHMSHYSATKGAVISLTAALAKEVVKDGVLVNCVSPGTVSSSKDADMDAYTSCELCYMERSGTDNENANLICFMASDEATYISGQNFQIDGCRKKI